jgi:RNA polymerase sigma-70 factor, ECF subfamily
VSSTHRASEPADEVLARRVQRGDRDAFELLVARYIRPVSSVIASFGGDAADVEDAVQDAFVRAISGIRTYDPARPFAPWLYEIARNVARRRLSTASARRTEPLSPLHIDGATPPDVLAERREIRSRVATGMIALPEQQRIVFRLHDVDGYSALEVAEIMGLSAGTVRSHLHYARRALRSSLADILDEPQRAQR